MYLKQSYFVRLQWLRYLIVHFYSIFLVYFVFNLAPGICRNIVLKIVMKLNFIIPMFGQTSKTVMSSNCFFSVGGTFSLFLRLTVSVLLCLFFLSRPQWLMTCDFDGFSFQILSITFLSYLSWLEVLISHFISVVALYCKKKNEMLIQLTLVTSTSGISTLRICGRIVMSRLLSLYILYTFIPYKSTCF